MRIHIVQKGETLWDIAKKYGVNFEELKKMNAQLSNPEMIMPGMKIKVPSTGVTAKKETPKSVGGVKEMPKSFTGTKEMPKAEHPYLPKKEKPAPVVQQPKEHPKEKPYTMYQPVMPEHQTLPEIDINNYYTINLKKQKVKQQISPQVQPAPVPPPLPQKVEEEPVYESEEVMPEMPIQEGVAQPVYPTFQPPMTMPTAVPCFDPCYNPCYNPCFHPCHSHMQPYFAPMMPQVQGVMMNHSYPYGAQQGMMPAMLPGVPVNDQGLMHGDTTFHHTMPEHHDDYTESEENWTHQQMMAPVDQGAGFVAPLSEQQMPGAMVQTGNCGCGGSGVQMPMHHYGWPHHMHGMDPFQQFGYPSQPMGTAMPSYAMPHRYDEGSDDE